MKKLKSNEIRNIWYEFFEKKNHQRIQSASLIPNNDKSLLWINAGVTPLKKYFDGTIVPANKRLVSIQKCIRTNDIENVGQTKRHHTFFEMMGNFSIGDYFKEEAISYTFELLTSKEYFDIPLEKLYFTVYPSDIDTYNKWISLGVNPNHITKLEDNFWEIGEGPCGPDTEIFFDRGEKYDPNGDAIELFMKGEDNERFIEIWNNVFSQYNSKEGVKREDYQELPSKNIDTGAGLERWTTIFQDQDSAFETDLFIPIISKIESITNTKYDKNVSYKVIADHIRAITFALADGATFENTGRGYILRRLIRRSIRCGKKLNMTTPFIYQLVDAVIDNYKSVYPYLIDKKNYIKNQVLIEEELFLKTLSSGEKRLYEIINKSTDKVISGLDTFKLYDTYGFPYELTEEYAKENNFTIDKVSFDKYMQEQKENSRSHQKQYESMSSQNNDLIEFISKSTFQYNTYQMDSNIIFMIENGQKTNEIKDTGYVIFDSTCFYATSGGQIYDTGIITDDENEAKVIEVTKSPNNQHLHKVKMIKGSLKLNNTYHLELDSTRRHNIEKNHSAVHLLQYALRHIISDTIHQKGSYVDDNKFRFDFNYQQTITDSKIVEVESLVKDLIKDNTNTITEIMEKDTAMKTDAMALFDEKYDEKVRVVTISKSKELCGGTHVSNPTEIKEFAIAKIESIGASIFRIEGTTNNVENILYDVIAPYNEEMTKILEKAKILLEKAKQNDIDLNIDFQINNNPPTCYQSIIDNQKELSLVQKEYKDKEKEYNNLLTKKILENITKYEEKITKLGNNSLLLLDLPNLEVSIIKEIMDVLTNKHPNLIIIFTSKNVKNTLLLIKTPSNISALEIQKELNSIYHGNGGGSNTLATGSIKDNKDDNQIKDIIVKILGE